MTIHMPRPQMVRPYDLACTPARVVALSDRQAAIFFDTDDSEPAARVEATCDGRPFPGPVAATRLGRQRGGARHVLLVARSAAEICDSSVRIEAAGRLLARIDPLALQSPLVDPLALVSGLDEAGGFRLLKLLLTTGASLFGKGDLGGFGVLAGQLLESLTSPVPLSSWCPVGRRGGILSWRLPAGVTLPTLRELCILYGGRARRFTAFTAVDEMAGPEKLLHLFVSQPLPDGADLIVLGERPVRLAGAGTAAARPLQGWLDRRGPQVRARLLAWLEGLASGDAQVSALRDELACPPGSEPRFEVLHLSETSNGILYLISVVDPRGLLAALSFTLADETVDVSCARLEWHAVHGTVATGFVPLTGRSGGRLTLRPRFVSGRMGAPVECEPVTFDARVPQAFHGLAEDVAASTLARALPAAMRARPVWRRRTTEFGILPAAPGFALVVAASDAPAHLHAVLAALVAEPGAQRAEIVVHHADGPASDLVRQCVASLAAIHRIGIRIVSVAPEAFPSERLRAALAECRAPRALALGAGALPDGPGWLASWRRRSGSGVIRGATRLCSGTVAGDGIFSFDEASLARLVQSRPLLPSIGPDLQATKGLSHRTTRRLSATVFGHAEECGLARAAEQLAARSMQEAADG